MSRNTKILLATLCAGTMFCPGAAGYTIPESPDTYVENPAQVDWVLDNPSPGRALVRSTRLLGGDTFAGFGGACPTADSCIKILVAENRSRRLFEMSAPGCLRGSGSGTLSEAATAFANKLFGGKVVPEVENRYGDAPSFIQINLRLCDNQSFHMTYRSTGSPILPIVCVIDAPAVVDLGRITANTTRIVRASVQCSGSGEADIRVSVLAPRSISPVSGLELWAAAPDRAVHVSSGGSPSYVDLTVGANVNTPEPGFYSGSFVYTIEYL
jgi:hypothetical protein